MSINKILERTAEAIAALEAGNIRAALEAIAWVKLEAEVRKKRLKVYVDNYRQTDRFRAAYQARLKGKAVAE